MEVRTMKLIRAASVLLVPFVWLGILLTAGTVETYAETGGTVRTNGVVIFYKEEPGTFTTDSPELEDNSVSPATKNSENIPTTGELVKKSLVISGGILIAIALILALIKRKHKEEKET